ncbi:MAG: hypothetical protein M3Y57_11830 [Acidobacteriota bacterium]|nr:hypothetical protein [Acidobacteriota bacterium]
MRFPGVRAAGFIQYLPLQNWGWMGGFSTVGRPGESTSEGPRAELRYPAQNTAATSDAGVSLAVSTFGEPEVLAKEIRDAIHQVNPHQALFDVETMDKVIDESISDLNLYLWLIGLFACLAVKLAVAGIYGMISYTVAGRTQEFGIRLALGAAQYRIVSRTCPLGGFYLS